MLPKHWTKPTRSTRTAFLASLVLIGAIALYNWIVAPHRNYLLAAQRYESATVSLAKKSQVISNSVTTKRKKLKKLHEKFAQINSRLFDPVKAGEFFGNIQTKAEEANCIVSSLSFLPAGSVSDGSHSQTNSYLTMRQAKLSVFGDYPNIVALLNEWQEDQKQVYIDSVRIGSDHKNSAYIRCDLTITIYVAHRKEEHQHD